MQLGPDPDVLLKNVSWEELAEALDKINIYGYRSVAEEARGNIKLESSMTVGDYNKVN